MSSSRTRSGCRASARTPRISTRTRSSRHSGPGRHLGAATSGANVEDLALAAPQRDDVTLVDLAAAIEDLPAGQRAAFVLRKLEGFGYVEIALTLDCSEEAARARVSEALKKVKAAVA